MIFEKMLMPDYCFDSFSAVTPEFLISIGASAVISDIDNTLVPYETALPTEEILGWIASLKEAGIPIALVSNNGQERVDTFASGLDCPAYYDVGKPGTKFILKAADDLKVEPQEAVFLGDQLLTDALAAHRAGMRAIILPPIKDKTSLFFKAKRLIERPYMEKYNRIHGGGKKK